MVKVSGKEKKQTKKGKKSVGKNKEVEKLNIKTYEKYTCFVVFGIVVLLFFSVIKNTIFIPAFLITIGLELFCIAYYFLDDNKKKDLVYSLFIFGVAFVVAAIIYTIFNTI